MRTRQYMTEIVGGEGNVLSHHTKPEELESKFEKIQDKESLRKFLTQVTYDKEGYVVLILVWTVGTCLVSSGSLSVLELTNRCGEKK